jgi:choline dehydrogenase-like flavoprotein
MGDFQIKKQAKEYDVVIVGSGAGGGMSAKVLAEAGLEVLVLEAGPHYDSAQGDMFKWNYESPRRGRAGKYQNFGDYDAAWGGWEIDGEPYTRKNNTKFDWFRARMLGGKTNHWGRISLRFGPHDFKRKDFDGLGDNWPIGYDDIKPYYDRIDKMIGIFGTNENILNEPDGVFMPPPKPRAHELLIKRAAEKRGVKMIPSRLSIITKPLGDRASCHYCSQCGRGCATYSNFSSPGVLLRPALKTGKLTIATGAMAREVIMNDQGRATGISYVDTTNLQEYQVSGKVIVLAASACESARLLLNSKSSRFPNGLANTSGIVGKYLHDSTGASASGFIPQLMDRTRYNEDGTGGMHLYSPWWLDNKKLDFPRGYHIEYGGGMGMPGYGFGSGIENLNGKVPMKNGQLNPKGGGGYGKQLKDDYRRFYGAQVSMSGRGESVPMESNSCEIDPNVVDKFGIPVLQFHYKWTDYEVKQAKHMQDTFTEIIESMGGTRNGKAPDAESQYGLANPGRIIHEVGTVRMGNDPKRSAVNKMCQAHDVKNLFVVDGGPFVSQADKNPTWTILALSLRTSEFIVDELKKHNI